MSWLGLRGDGGTRLLAGVTTILLLYLSYRYPLQINFSGTSPVYSDTPLALQLGKFLFATLACLFAVFRFRALPVNSNGLVFLVCLIGLIAYSLIKAFQGDKVFIEFAFWPIVALILCVYSGVIDLRSVDRGIACIFGFSVCVEVIQLYLFLFHDRLPALAWENSISIRFGSFLDDPNGFAALCFLFLGWSIYRSTAICRVLCGVLSVAMILVSQSLTAIVFLMPLLTLMILMAIAKRPVCIAIGILVLSLALAMGAAGGVVDLVQMIFEYKQGSINQHASFELSDIAGDGLISLLFGSNEYVFYESWWAQAAHNWGVLWSATLLLLSIYASGIMLFNAHRSDIFGYRGVWAGFAFFLIYFVLGGLNLPFFIIFPLNYIFFIIIAATLLGRLRVIPKLRLNRVTRERLA